MASSYIRSGAHRRCVRARSRRAKQGHEAGPVRPAERALFIFPPPRPRGPFVLHHFAAYTAYTTRAAQPSLPAVYTAVTHRETAAVSLFARAPA